MLTDFAKAEAEDPSPRKEVNESHVIYQSREFRRPTGGKSYGLPILCDFGEARIGKRQESGPFIQPSIYRAPEITFEMPWGSPVDIWNLAGLVSTALLQLSWRFFTDYLVGLGPLRRGPFVWAYIR